MASIGFLVKSLLYLLAHTEIPDLIQCSVRLSDSKHQEVQNNQSSVQLTLSENKTKRFRCELRTQVNKARLWRLKGIKYELYNRIILNMKHEVL